MHLLAKARELVGRSDVVIRVDTDLIETVYVEVRDGNVIVHDRGETWFYIVTHPESYASWDHARAVRLCSASSVTMVAEEDDGETSRLVLERSLAPDDRLANVVSIVADVVDALFDAHSLAGGWRDFGGPYGAPDDSVA